LGKAPVRRATMQNNHVFAVLYATFKLECLKIKRHLDHFAFRSHLYLKATRTTFDELQAHKAAYHQLLRMLAIPGTMLLKFSGA
jgi:hypothetical protein